MADLSTEEMVGIARGWCSWILNNDDAGSLDVVVDDWGIEARLVVDVVEGLRKVGGDLHSGEPGGEEGEAGVVGVAEAGGQTGPRNVRVNQIDVVAGGGDAHEGNDARVVALAE